ncbi:ABC transporter permease [Pseudothermotoga thermarum]|uniref:Binding-protein-dependent transport systems inner membrane component n=1 Tax=Pseudothermotoga thermarum DSM 5069 TaxID=688269 RepID=F7YXX1_9THEM|nr:ABC transporter permease [Pseudothermotoga thermarum]AEH50770.1 binding-protein-dependent transport systems inner membrane component [Pseudothermotoga thermarum DSM 5069]
MAEVNGKVMEKELISEEVDFQEKYLSRGQLIWRAFLKHRLGVVALVILIVLYIMALFADFLAPYDPLEQSLRHTYAPPTKIHRTYKGQKVKPYILPIISFVDKVTYERTYKEMLFPSRIVVEKPDGQREAYELGKDGVESIRFQISSVESIKINGEWVDVKRSPRIAEYLLFGYNDEALAKGQARFETSSAVAQEVYFKSYGSRFGLTDEEQIEAVAITETIESIVIRKDGRPQIVTGKIVDYDYKIYPVKWFVKSWTGKLFWLFPLSVHLFGVDNYDNNPYVKLFIMGADLYGRDVWSRIVFASRISLSIGFIGMVITFALAMVFGGISGYYGGLIDEALMRFAEIIMSIPNFYLLIMLRAMLPLDLPSTQIYILLVFILAFIGWAGTSRVIRGMVLSIRQREFVEAAIAIGLPNWKVLTRHVLPNTATYLIVASTLRIPGYILGEAGLSFLGLGIREPYASWGLMLAQAQDVYVITRAPWLLIPGLFIIITCLSFNTVGDALRDALDPRSLG